MSARSLRSFARPAAALLLVVGLGVGLLAATGSLPVAPPPREAKPAKVQVDPKLLVGKWRVVAIAPQPLHPDCTITYEFNEHGRYRADVLTNGRRPQHDAGAYVVDGNSVLFQPDRPILPEEPISRWTVVALTLDRLDLAGQGKEDHHRLFLVRVRDK